MQITQLWIYPVKALQGIAVESSKLLTTGLPRDRQWMIVDNKGNFVSQRQLPSMATIQTSITDEHLILRHQSTDPLHVPLDCVGAVNQTVKIWNDEILAEDIGEHASKWLTQVLGLFRKYPLRLIRFADDQQRAVSEKHLKSNEFANTKFSDGYPFLITSEQSLAWLNQHLQNGAEGVVPMQRFRPNIVVDEMDEPFSELFAKDIKSAEGKYRLGLRKPCERCPVTTVDQESGQRVGKLEPLATLRALNPLTDKPGAFFGGNTILLDGEGATIRVGDKLE